MPEKSIKTSRITTSTNSHKIKSPVTSSVCISFRFFDVNVKSKRNLHIVIASISTSTLLTEDPVARVITHNHDLCAVRELLAAADEDSHRTRISTGMSVLGCGMTEA